MAAEELMQAGSKNLAQLKRQVKKLANPEKAAVLQRFFKTGRGEYGAGDRFLGLVVPQLRRLAKEYQDLPLPSVKKLVGSRIHEERLLALLILIRQYGRGDAAKQARVYKLYCGNFRHVNNWDLVDLSAEHIIGHYLAKRGKQPLYRLARSRDVWQRRISIISTFHYIKQKEYAETLKIARLLLKDREDLIHKALGWMLREVGKRDLQTEESFLKRHYKKMPRTMLRYAIERFPESRRKAYLLGQIC